MAAFSQPTALNHRFKAIVLLSLVLLGLTLNFYACSESKPAFDREKLFQDTTQNVVIPAYEALTQQSKALHQKLQGLCGDINEANLNQAQVTWQKSVQAWQHVALYRFGPALEKEAISHIHYWPTKPASVEEEVKDSTTLDVAYVNQLGASRRGLPAIGYLLFAKSADDKAPLEALKGEGDKSSRRCQFATVLAEAIHKQAEAIEKSWKDKTPTEWVSFYDDPVLEGQAIGPAFKAVNKIVNEFMYQLATAMDKKLGKPLGTQSDGEPRPDNIELPHSRYSKESLLSLLEGLQRFYNGGTSTPTATSFSALIQSRKADADTQIQKEFSDAIQAIQAIPGTLYDAVSQNKDKVQAAYDAIKQLRITFSTDVVALLGVTTTFSDNDGD